MAESSLDWGEGGEEGKGGGLRLSFLRLSVSSGTAEVELSAGGLEGTVWFHMERCSFLGEFPAAMSFDEDVFSTHCSRVLHYHSNYTLHV